MEGGRGEGETHQMLVVSKCQQRGASAERARAHGSFLASPCFEFPSFAISIPLLVLDILYVATERRESQCLISLFLFFLLACDSFLKLIFINLKFIGM